LNQTIQKSERREELILNELKNTDEYSLKEQNNNNIDKCENKIDRKYDFFLLCIFS